MIMDNTFFGGESKIQNLEKKKKGGVKPLTSSRVANFGMGECKTATFTEKKQHLS